MKTDLIMITFEARHGNLTWFITLLSLLSRTLENFTTKLKKNLTTLLAKFTFM